MKGRYKKRRSHFKVGHRRLNNEQRIYTNDIQRYVRLSIAEYKSVIPSDCDIIPRDADDQLCLNGAHLLRPCQDDKDSIITCGSEDGRSDMGTMKLFHPVKLENLINEAIVGHREMNCDGMLRFDDVAERQVGICFQERLMCSKCTYKSSLHKLYNEVKTSNVGRKSAAPNLGLQVGLTHTGVGNGALQSILMAAGVCPPAMSGLQKLSNKVGAKLVQENIKDMEKRCEFLRKINLIKGLKASAPIRIEGDCRFNTPLYAGSEGETPYQPATQCVYTVCENVTSDKQIIAVSTNNKLCHKGSLRNHMSNSFTATCDHPGECSSTISRHHSIGDEGKWASECLEFLCQQELNVKYFTTDCDSRAASAGAKLFEDGHFSHRPIHLKCTRHLGSSHRKMIKRAIFSDTMFPGKTKEERVRKQARFALDLRSRVSAEMNLTHKNNIGNLAVQKEIFDKMPEVIAQCVIGNHQQCKSKSALCGGIKRPWKFRYLNQNTKLTCTSQDIKTIVECIKYRLNDKNICATRFQTNTNKTEAVNRAYNLRNPKHLTYSRNFPSRIHSTVHQVNNGPGKSMSMQCKAVGNPITEGSRLSRNLALRQHKRNYMQQYKKRRENVQRRYAKRSFLFNLYDHQKNNVTYSSDLIN